MNQRYSELDGLRGLASLSVFFSHAIGMLTLSGIWPQLSNSPLHLFWDGAAAVFLFFILSGFVLALPYVSSTREIDVVPFMVRRVFRIYPAYLFAIVCSLLLMRFIFVPGGLAGLSQWIQSFWKAGVTTSDIVKHITMYGADTDKIDPPTWTLRVEFYVSLMFPFILLLFRWKKAPAISAFVAAALALLFFRKPSYALYIGLFVTGAIMAKYSQVLIARIQSLGATTRVALMILAIVLYTGRFSIPYLPDGTGADIIVSAGAALLVILSLSVDWFSRMLKTRPVSFMGDISYSFYLLHLPILLAVSSIVFPLTNSLLLSWSASLAISVAAAAFAFRWIEKPMQQVGRGVSKNPVFAVDVFRQADQA